jgi:hypothetical protein
MKKTDAAPEATTCVIDSGSGTSRRCVKTSAAAPEIATVVPRSQSAEHCGINNSFDEGAHKFRRRNFEIEASITKRSTILFSLEGS